MLHTRFPGNHSNSSGEDFLRVFTIYGHGDHLALNLNFLVSTSLHTKFDSKWPTCF